jgi:hypothetical protein
MVFSYPFFPIAHSFNFDEKGSFMEIFLKESAPLPLPPP